MELCFRRRAAVGLVLGWKNESIVSLARKDDSRHPLLDFFYPFFRLD